MRCLLKITLTGPPDLLQRQSLSTKAFRLNFHSSLREANFWSQVLRDTSHAMSIFLGYYITKLSVTSKLVSPHKDALTIDKSPFSLVSFFFYSIEFHWTRITFSSLKGDFKFHTYLSRNTLRRRGNFYYKVFFFFHRASKRQTPWNIRGLFQKQVFKAFL